MSSWFRSARDAKAISLDWKNNLDNNCTDELVKRRFSNYVASKIETAIIAGDDSVMIYSPDLLYDYNNIEGWFMQHGGDGILSEIADELRERGYRVKGRGDYYLLDIEW